MNKTTTKTIIAAQPDYFNLMPYRDGQGVLIYRKDAIIAWCITTYEDEAGGSVCAHPITADAEWQPLCEPLCILRPDGMIEETDQPIRSLSSWLADPDLLKRHP